MANRIKAFRSLLTSYEASLKAFQSSSSNFRVLKTVHPSDPFSPQEPARPPLEEQPSTLYILDSSFNPPTIAHQNLAISALENAIASNSARPHRLLLLFATSNADKTPSPKAFSRRLTLMTLFSSDLLTKLQSDARRYSVVPIDIGVTTAPYYTDKTKAIETDAADFYTSRPKHVHLIGYDTLIRFFAAKYYKSFDPPLSALAPFFDGGGHCLRVTLRPEEGDENSLIQQREFVKRLADGQMAHEGGKPEWARQVELVSPNPRIGVSSTKIRDAAKQQQWDRVAELCTPSVAEWVQSEGLYAEDS